MQTLEEGRSTGSNSIHAHRVFFLLPVVAAVYMVLAMATPMSYDFFWNIIWHIEAPTESILERAFYAPWLFCMKGFYRLLSDLGLAPVQRPVEVVGIWYFQATPAAYLLLLTLKLPIIIFTLADGIVLYKLARSAGATPNHASTAMLVWFVNPLVMITTVMWGTWDVAALFFMLLSLLLLHRGRTVLSSLSLIVGFGVKVVPIIALPVYLLHLYRTNRRRFLQFTVTSVSLLALSAVAALAVGGERLAAGAQQILSVNFPFFAGVSLETGLFQLSSTVAALSLFILFAAVFWRFKEDNLPALVLAYFLIFFAFAFWHPHYLVYVWALLAIDYAITRKHATSHLTLVVTAIGTSIIVFGYFFSSWGHSVLFIPNYTQTMQELSFFILMLPGHPIGFPVGVALRLIFGAACIYYAAMMFLRNTTRTLPALPTIWQADRGRKAPQLLRSLRSPCRKPPV